MRLEDRVAIVTGASRGIGRAIALGLAKEGANLIVNYNRSTEKAFQVVEQIKAMSQEAVAVKADVSKRVEVDKMVKETVEKFGKIDILVNNAGISSQAPFLEISEKMWDEIFSVDIKGTFFCSQAVGREMVRQRKGKIINVSSISAEVATSTLVHYCAAKAAVNMLTKGMALALAPYNINVNCIAPGVIETDIVRDLLKKPANRKPVIERTPSRVIGQPDDCVGIVVYLASDESNHINGQIIAVDGGYLAQGPEWDFSP